MNIEAKPRTVVTVVLVIAILAGGYFYWVKTAEKRVISAATRAYKAEIKQLRMIDEHQSLDIKVFKQKVELEAIRREIEKKTPRYNLTPKDPNQ